MSQRIASLHAYDVLDMIQWTYMVREYPSYQEGPSVVVSEGNGTLPSRGLELPEDWLRDVLRSATPK